MRLRKHENPLLGGNPLLRERGMIEEGGYTSLPCTQRGFIRHRLGCVCAIQRGSNAPNQGGCIPNATRPRHHIPHPRGVICSALLTYGGAQRRKVLWAGELEVARASHCAPPRGAARGSSCCYHRCCRSFSAHSRSSIVFGCHQVRDVELLGSGG